MGPSVRVEVRVEGIVQGVGFRPFVYALADRFGVSGHVGNDTDGVFLAAEGPREAVTGLLKALETDAPALAAVERVTVTEHPVRGGTGFRIVPSAGDGPRRTPVSADAATCAACLSELFDPADRRYRYPFLNCTDCGPRFSIVRDVPYDRPNTTMAGFALCAACAAEYHDPADRRFHAQPTCCPACGPRMRLTDAAGRSLGDDPVRHTAELLRAGAVVAVKGIGGYHLATDATDEAATAALRSRKHRADKPFAVMVPTLDTARALCHVDDLAERLLTGRQAPVVLLERGPDSRGDPTTAPAVAPSVAPGNRELGLMLPYTPLHHLLLDAVAAPLVLTSGNVSDEPLAYTDDDALARLSGIADAFLTHDRPIHVRTDDSVVRPWRDRALPVRRARGYAPEPIRCGPGFPRPVLACGAEQKNTVCLAHGRRAVCSPHLGDLENHETLRAFTAAIDHLGRLCDLTPAVVAHDLHPDYLSTKYARERDDVELVGVQHHHAHLAACLADNGVDGPVLGVAFDGTGYGTDGTVWGGEFLLATLTGFERLAHLAPVPMPGGAAAIRHPWRMAAAHLRDAGDDELRTLPLRRRHDRLWPRVRFLAGTPGPHTPETSSAGRLFDAVAAVLDVRDTVTYEGQAAIELEQRADPTHRGGYPVPTPDPPTAGGARTLDGTALLRAVLDDRARGGDLAVVAARFHNTVAALIAATCGELAGAKGVSTVALSGGVFQNRLLLDRTVEALDRKGLTVLTHTRVPCNDGGISLGQAAVAGALDRAARRS